MAIDLATATSWTNVGAQDAAQRTHASIIRALQGSTALADKDVETFLQGSYANSTNIRSDSDVDVVAMSRRTFYHDLERLNTDERAQFHRDHNDATYSAQQLRSDVLNALRGYYGVDRIEEHSKCIRVLGSNGYVDADVVPAFQYRLYNRYGLWGTDYTEGTILFPRPGGNIINYPKEHKKNGEAKNLNANGNFKSTVRQLKRLKRHAVEQQLLDPDSAPGYLLECLVYNVPSNLFTYNDHQRLVNVMAWLTSANLNSFTSVDQIHSLFGSDPGKFNVMTAASMLWTLASILD